MDALPSLDAHAHVSSSNKAGALADAGAVLAMTLSLDEAEQVVDRGDPFITWAVGCHPRKLRSQQAFDRDRFRWLAEKFAIIGEIGLDGGSRVSLELQLETFRQALGIATELSRIVSIHSYQATRMESATQAVAGSDPAWVDRQRCGNLTGSGVGVLLFDPFGCCPAIEVSHAGPCGAHSDRKRSRLRRSTCGDPLSHRMGGAFSRPTIQVE
jgi:hypothetical protein